MFVGSESGRLLKIATLSIGIVGRTSLVLVALSTAYSRTFNVSQAYCRLLLLNGKLLYALTESGAINCAETCSVSHNYLSQPTMVSSKIT
jgi:hypothetical protein